MAEDIDRAKRESIRRSMLVVDDEVVFRERLARAIEQRGYSVRTAGDGQEALVLAHDDSPELAVIDLRMPGAPTGAALVRALLEIEPAMEIVVLTGYGSIASAVEAMRAGARGYCAKPITPDALLMQFSQEQGAPNETPAQMPSLARVEWEHIQRVLHDCDGNVTAAARALGIHRRSLQRKLAKFPAQR